MDLLILIVAIILTIIFWPLIKAYALLILFIVVVYFVFRAIDKRY